MMKLKAVRKSSDSLKMLQSQERQLGPSRHDIHFIHHDEKLAMFTTVISPQDHPVPTMSTFGSPGGQQKIQKPIPCVRCARPFAESHLLTLDRPERGSFPLDHEGIPLPSLTPILNSIY